MRRQTEKNELTPEGKRKPFSIHWFLAVQPACAVVSFICAITLDNTLRIVGVEVHPWKDALTAALGGVFFMTTCAPLAWRVGLTTLPQYFLAAISLFMPATIIWLLVTTMITPIQIDMTAVSPDLTETRMWAMSIYIRIVRSAILSPAYIFAFWFFYHHLLGRDAYNFSK